MSKISNLLDKFLKNILKEETIYIGKPPPTPQQKTPTPSPEAIQHAIKSIQGFKTWTPPQEYVDMVNKNSQQYDVPPSLIAAILQNESGFNPKVSDNYSVMESGIKSRDRGMAQISDYWNPDVTDEQAYDPRFSIEYIAKTLRNRQNKYDNWAQSVASYNVGGRVGPHPSRNERGLGPVGEEYLRKAKLNLEDDIIKKYGL